MIASTLTPESLLLAALKPQVDIITSATNRQLSGIMATIEAGWKDGKLPTKECVAELVLTLYAEAEALRILYKDLPGRSGQVERVSSLAETHAKVKAGDLQAGQDAIKEAKGRCKPKSTVTIRFEPPTPGDLARMYEFFGIDKARVGRARP